MGARASLILLGGAVAVAALAAGAGAAGGGAAPGRPCTTPKQTIQASGAVLVCAQQGGSLVWQPFDKNAPGGVAGGGGIVGGGHGGKGHRGHSGNHSNGARPGAPCPQAGTSVNLQSGQQLLCTQSGGKLRWVVQAGSGGNGSGSSGGNGSGGSGGNGGQPTAAQQAPPVIEQWPVAFGPYDGSSHAGDFTFTHDSSPAKGPISEFADQISSGNGTKLTSEIGFDWLRPNAPVSAVGNGVITRTDYQSDTGDYEVWEEPVQNSEWHVIYDHVNGLAVQIGQQVTTGTQIGVAHAEPGTSIAFVELQIAQWANDKTTQWCPSKFVDPAVAATLDKQLTDLMSAWESYRGDSSIYDPAKDVYPACLEESYVGG